LISLDFILIYFYNSWFIHYYLKPTIYINMSFRKYGGINYNAKHNNVTSNYNSANKLNVMDFVGQDNSDIIFESDIVAKGGIRVVENIDISGNLIVDGTTTLNGATTINDTLDVNGFVNINNSANITDLLEANAINLTSGQITTNQNGVVPKSYVDAVASGVKPQPASSCATDPYGSANLNLSSLPSPFVVDDYVVQNGDRVLVKNQDQTGTITDKYYSTNSVNNGIYVYNSATNSLTRASDYADGFSAGSTTTFIENGTVNSKIIYIQISAPAIVGIDPLQYAVFYTIQLSLGQGLEYVPVNVLQVTSDLSFVTQVGTLNTLDVLVPNTPASSIENASGFQFKAGTAIGDVFCYFGADNTNKYSYVQSVTRGEATRPFIMNARGGNVGIGLTNPSSRLQVNGTVTATSYNATSDYRIKENVENLKLDEYNIDNLRPVTYTHKETKEKCIGLIAHEVAEEFPFLVQGDKDGENIQSVNYTGLVGVLIKEMQELKNRVEFLEQQIKTMNK